MLFNKQVHPTLPAVDIKRARNFYEEKLGLKFVIEDSSPGIWLRAGGDSMLYLYQRGPTKADHTVASFDVDNIEAEVRELKSKGVIFEEYDIPEMGIKTVNGIATMSMDGYQMRAAWFKDSEGNILALNEMAKNLKEKMMSQMATAPAYLNFS